MRALTGVGCVALLLVLAGCANGSSEQEAASAAARFLTATSRGDGQTACDLLTPLVRQNLVTSQGQPCPQSLPMDQLRGTVGQAEVWSDWARVSTNQGTVFLTQFDNGWLVSAAGCRANGDAPDLCVVGG